MLEITTHKQGDAYQQDAFEQLGKHQTLLKLLRKASKLAHDNERISELASRAITLAETLNDATRQVEGSLLLAKHYLAKDKFQKVVDTLEPFLDERSELPNHTRAQLSFTFNRRVLYRLEEIAKVLRYGADGAKTISGTR